MSESPLPRVRWREGQYLTADDLAAEQVYRVDARRRHARGSHRWGVVAGLDLRGDGAGLAIEPGLAIDGFGRRVCLAAPHRFATGALADAFAELGEPPWMAVWILYGRAPESGPRRRWSQASLLRLTGLDAPPVPGESLDARPGLEPQAAAPDDPAVEWPVFLGALTRLDGALAVSAAGRRDAGIAAARVSDPLDRVAISFVEPPGPGRFELAVGDGAEPPSPRVTVDRRLVTRLAGGASLRSHARLDESGPGPSQRLRFAELESTPEEARAWSVYRTTFQAANAAGAPVGPARRQLRFEIGAPDPAGAPDGYLFAVGDRPGETFVPRLAVDADCRVAVHDLRVGGRIREAPIPADPSDPRFGREVAQSWLGGVETALTASAEVAVSVALTHEGPIFGPISYRVTVSNPGQVNLTTVGIYASLALDGAAGDYRSIGSVGPLAPGAQQVLDAETDLTGDGDYVLTVAVYGVSTGNLVVAASDEVAFVAEEPVIL